MWRGQGCGAISYPAPDNGLIEDFLDGPDVRVVGSSSVGGTPVSLFELLPEGGRGDGGGGKAGMGT